MTLRRLKERVLSVRQPNEMISPESDHCDPKIANKTFFQGFEWYLPSDGRHYHRLREDLDILQKLGVDQVWLPPGCKAGWVGSNGYDVYDAYDLGQFNQKGAQRTKFGSKRDLLDLSSHAQSIGMKLCWDAVLNHRCAADYTEKCEAVKVDPQDRRRDLSGPHEVEVWTGYNFSSRNEQYSSFKYHWYHFTGTDWEANLQTNENIYRFVGDGKQGWANDVDDTLGNYDYLMGNDLDHSHDEVKADLQHWATWIIEEVGLSGFRLDAIKHMSQSFLQEWIRQIDKEFPDRVFFVGEYWREDLHVLGPVIERFKGRLHLFDVALAGNMSKISHNPSKSDIRTIFDETLMRHYPNQAVTFVLNHDTQPRYERDHHVVPISQWFIPLGYAIILLIDTPAYPCVFYGDLYGTTSPNPEESPHLAQPPSCWGILPRLMLARRFWAYGPGTRYFDDPHCVGFVRSGRCSGSSESEGLAVLMNIGTRHMRKKMFLGMEKRGRVFTDLLEFAWGEIRIDEEGYGDFPVGPRSVGVWVAHDAIGRKNCAQIASKFPGAQ